MNRRQLLSRVLVAPLALGVAEGVRATPYIDGPCCAVTDNGAYLHYSCFGDAVCATFRKDVKVVRVCSVTEYHAMIQRICDDMEKNPDKYFEEWEYPSTHDD